METVQKQFKEYLTLTGYLGKQAHLGPTDKEVQIEVKEEHNKLLEDLLQKQKKGNKTEIWLTIVLMIIISTGIIVFVGFFINNWNNLLTISGGVAGIITLLLTQLLRLRKRWSENAIIDAALGLVDDLPKEEAAKVILSMYLNSLGDGE